MIPLVFRFELKQFLDDNRDREFPTCNGRDCVVAQFLRHKDPTFNGSVSAKRIRNLSGDGVETLDNQPWLKEFIGEVDMEGIRHVQHAPCYPHPQFITGATALRLLEGIPDVR